MKTTGILVGALFALMLPACGSSEVDDNGYCQAFCENYAACEHAAGRGFNMDGCLKGCRYEYPGFHALRDDNFLAALQSCFAQPGCNDHATCVQQAINESQANYQSDPDYQDCSNLAGVCDNFVLNFSDNCTTLFTLESTTPLEGADTTPFSNAVTCAKGQTLTVDGCLDRSAPLAANSSAIVAQCVADKIAGQRADDCGDNRNQQISDCQDPDGNGNSSGDGPYYCRRDGSSCTTDEDCVTDDGEVCVAGACVAESCNIDAPHCNSGYSCVEVDEYCEITVDAAIEQCRISNCADEEEAATNETLGPCLGNQTLSQCIGSLDAEYQACLCFNTVYCLNDAGTFAFPD